MSDFTQVDEVKNFEDGDMKDYQVGNYHVLVSQVDGEFYAVEAICTHEYAELVDGDLDGHYVVCPLHFACFDIRTGAAQDPPAKDPLLVFDVKVEDGGIFVSNQPVKGD